MSLPGRLICRTTGEEYPIETPVWKSASGGLLDLEFTPVITPALIAGRGSTLWRYREAFPIPPGATPVTFQEGFTPLLELDLDGHPVWIKQDHLFPSGSYKDRGAAVMVSMIAHLGIRRVVEDSSGNAGCAVAAYCARAGIQCDIYVPASTSSQKLLQMDTYGAVVHRIQGNREETAAAALAAAENTYYASHSWNPFFFQGTKTFAYEVVEQLGWRAPDIVVLPAGNGTLVLGSYIGFRELRACGLIDRLPRLIAVQASACAPLFQAFLAGDSHVSPIHPVATIAEGIAIAAPVRGAQILECVRETGGSIVAVTDDEVSAAARIMGSRGFFLEPTAAATIAGLRKWLTRASPRETVVSVFTGHGLKGSKAGTVPHHPGGT
jgi:threonine synthase